MDMKCDVSSSTFLQDHTTIHELISMNNGMYIIWKMIFPRVDDTFVTADKLLDLWIWKELYNVLTRITVEYNDSTNLVEQRIGSDRYELSFKKIHYSNDCIGDLFNVDINSIREILCVNLVVNRDCHLDLVDKLVDVQNNNVGPDKEIHEISVDSGIKAKQVEPTTQSFIRQDLSDDDGSIESQPKKDCELFKTHFMNDDLSDSTESLTLDEAIKRKIPTPARQSYLNSFSIASSDYSSDDDSSYKSSASKIRKIDQIDQELDIGSIPELVDENMDIPKDLQELRMLMNDQRYLDKFGFEQSSIPKTFRLFDGIYTVDGDIRFAAFYSAMCLKHIQGNCHLFFHFSQELLGQFNSFSEVKLAGVNHILMVFVNIKHDELTPIGFFLLPNKETLRNVPSIINGWLGKESPTCVTKCIIPYEEHLQSSISEVWPNAKILGCSTEYQREVKLFAKQNKGLGAEHKTKLTRLACSLCYLDENHISVGINVIQAHSKSDYGTKLVEHLRTQWADRLKSVNGERIIYRSLDICTLFSKKVERDYFAKKDKLRHVWDSISFLKTLTFTCESDLSQLLAEPEPILANKNFGCTTRLQKEKENRIVGLTNELNTNDKTMTEFTAVEQFMLKMVKIV